MSLNYDYLAGDQKKFIAIKIVCPKCHQTGEATWGVEAEMSLEGSMSQLLSVSDGFYQRVSKGNKSDIETVCGGCGFVLV